VYFIHGQYAGISAFVQGEADESQRHAAFVTVGVLVPLSYGRLGKSWLRAPHLRRLAAEAVQDTKDTRSLELYWKQHSQATSEDGQAASSSTSGGVLWRAELDPIKTRTRSSASNIFAGSSGLQSDHPASSMTALLDTFGPLIFPLYRAALLRKRILLLGAAPVQQTCNFVYLLSVLSNLPQAQTNSLPTDSEALLRTQPLFNVGIHDIPSLSDRKRQPPWLACTTDDILGEKKELYDVLISLRNLASHGQPSKRRSVVTLSDRTVVKATHRDLRRYRLLRAELDRVRSISIRYRDDPQSDAGEDNDDIPLAHTSTSTLFPKINHNEPDGVDVIEPVSWSAMAYNGFMWWASAGEMDAWETEETATDRQLLDDLPEMNYLLPHPGDSNTEDGSMGLQAHAVATIVTAYFHRLTAQMVQPLANLVEAADDDTEEGIADAAIAMASDDVRAMGLDSWSLADQDFAKHMMQTYFGREAVLEAGGTRICGVRVC